MAFILMIQENPDSPGGAFPEGFIVAGIVA
jgi:hypothetical protein